ncbi:shikimate dehydrogenase [Nocardioides flavescens]|uniref:shikimate dehydrogenase n=1 Tax=Nocardioides flavescens TaxID=2691959 RepID=UPI00301D061F
MSDVKKCAVLGDPVGHSLSPVIHRTAYDAWGLDWEYDAHRVEAGGLADFLDGLDPAEWRGLSLTMPLKREAVPLLDSADDWVRVSGAANTLLLEPDGTRRGLNTDVSAALELTEGLDVDTALVLGGGATAASMLLALAEHGLERATIVVRDPARATETVRVVTSHRPVQLDVVTFEDLPTTVVVADLVVSTIPVTAQTPDVVASTMDAAHVFEVVYDPWPTPVAAAAERSDRPVTTGLDLLMAQAVHQVRAMTGRDDVPVEEMRRAAVEQLESRVDRAPGQREVQDE